MPARLDLRTHPDRFVVFERKRALRCVLILVMAIWAGVMVLAWRGLDALGAGTLIAGVGLPLGAIFVFGAAPRRSLEVDWTWGEIRERFTWMGLPLREARVDLARCRAVETRCLNPAALASRRGSGIEGLGLLLGLLGPIGWIAGLIVRGLAQPSQPNPGKPVYGLALDVGEPRSWIPLRTENAADAERAAQAIGEVLSDPRFRRR